MHRHSFFYEKKMTDYEHGSAVRLKGVINLGAILIFVFFVRCIVTGTLHPRVALFMNTILVVVNDLAHFMLTFVVLFVALALIGHVFMGSYRADFSGLAISLQTQFMIITGTFPFPDSGIGMPAIELLYLLSFAFIVFFSLTYASVHACTTACLYRQPPEP